MVARSSVLEVGQRRLRKECVDLKVECVKLEIVFLGLRWDVCFRGRLRRFGFSER